MEVDHGIWFFCGALACWIAIGFLERGYGHRAWLKGRKRWWAFW